MQILKLLDHRTSRDLRVVFFNPRYIVKNNLDSILNLRYI